jgi:hypothetical protein
MKPFKILIILIFVIASCHNQTNIPDPTETPYEKDIFPDQARIGDLRFIKTAKNWKLAFAYLEYDTIDSLKK